MGSKLGSMGSMNSAETLGQQQFDRLAEKHGSAAYRADEEVEIMARKNFAATGSFIAADRPRALDLLGFSSQLVFNTFHNRRLRDWEHHYDIDFGPLGSIAVDVR